MANSDSDRLTTARRTRADKQPILVAVKAFHTIIWFSVEAAVVYLLVAGLRRRSGRSVAVAGVIVGGEALVFLGNGARCPLTDVAESLGAERGSVTDIYLPKWLAHNLPVIHVPLLALIGYLHGRTLLTRRRGRLT